MVKSFSCFNICLPRIRKEDLSQAITKTTLNVYTSRFRTLRCIMNEYLKLRVAVEKTGEAGIRRKYVLQHRTQKSRSFIGSGSLSFVSSVMSQDNGNECF